MKNIIKGLDSVLKLFNISTRLKVLKDILSRLDLEEGFSILYVKKPKWYALNRY